MMATESACPLRFAAVLSHPTQHHSPVFRALARQPGIRVRAYYLCDHGIRESNDAGFGVRYTWDVPLLDGYEHEFLRPGFSPHAFAFREIDSSLLNRRLDDYRPHAVWIHGYGQHLSWRAVRWANRHQAAVLYFGDSELIHQRPFRTRVLKRIVLPRFFSRCDAFITVGDNNEAYYRHYGVPQRKLFRGNCPIEVGRFRSTAAAVSPDERKALRLQWKIPPSAFVVAFSGKLQQYKRPVDLVEALGLLKSVLEPTIHALVLGAGPLRNELVARARRLGIEDRVHLTGFVNQSAMPVFLRCADALAVPSERDAHPLAVAEALAVGLPVIVSDRVGCVGKTDSARPGENALVYSCGDTEALAAAITRLAHDRKLYQQMAASASHVADEQDVSVTVAAIVRALHELRSVFLPHWGDAGETLFRQTGSANNSAAVCRGAA